MASYLIAFGEHLILEELIATVGLQTQYLADYCNQYLLHPASENFFLEQLERNTIDEKVWVILFPMKRIAEHPKLKWSIYKKFNTQLEKTQYKEEIYDELPTMCCEESIDEILLKVPHISIEAKYPIEIILEQAILLSRGLFVLNYLQSHEQFVTDRLTRLLAVHYSIVDSWNLIKDREDISSFVVTLRKIAQRSSSDFSISLVRSQKLTQEQLLQVLPEAMTAQNAEGSFDIAIEYRDSYKELSELLINNCLTFSALSPSLEIKIMDYVFSTGWENSDRLYYAVNYCLILNKKPEKKAQVESALLSEIKKEGMSPTAFLLFGQMAINHGSNDSFVVQMLNSAPDKKGIFHEKDSELLDNLVMGLLIKFGALSLAEQVLAKAGHQINRVLHKFKEISINPDNHFPIVVTPLELTKKLWREKVDPLCEAMVKVGKSERIRLYDVGVYKIAGYLATQPHSTSRLWALAAQQFGIFSKEAMDILQGKSHYVEVKKDGSKLYALFGKNIGALVNEIPEESLSTWVLANEKGIPIAPILKTSEKEISKDIVTHFGIEHNIRLRRVFSRYTGPNLAEFLYYFDSAETRKIIEDQITATHQLLNQEQISHGHPHLGNFTIEFWETEYLNSADNKGKNINQLELAPNRLHFDPSLYFKEKHRWTPIIRLIDWDSSSSKDIKTN